MNRDIDPFLLRLIQSEHQRQSETINLIASENYASHAVSQAVASCLTNKYAEGYPTKRYYAGCDWVDRVEMLAIERCKELFNAQHVNVQPHAGSQANMAVYHALLQPGDTILGMSLAAGGHLTHGHKVNFSGSWYTSVQYSVDPKTECIDYQELERLAHIHKPKLIIVGASAYSRIIDFDRCAEIARNVGAFLHADIAHIAGLIAAKVHPSPVGHADVITSTTHKTLRGPRGGLIMSDIQHAELIDRAIMPGTQGGPFMNSIAAKAVAFYEALQPSFVDYQKQVVANAKKMASIFKTLGYRIVAGGTDNHLFIVDLSAKNITGLQAEKALEDAGITVSRSCIPFDTQKPWITSGIRIGTPAISTRGMKEQDVELIVHFIDEAIQNHENQHALSDIRTKVLQVCQQFPLDPHTMTTQNNTHDRLNIHV